MKTPSEVAAFNEGIEAARQAVFKIEMAYTAFLDEVAEKGIGIVGGQFKLEAWAQATAQINALTLPVPAAPQPQAWKLVPVEPTAEMLQAASNEPFKNFWTDAELRAAEYRAMLAVAPAAPQPDGLVERLDAITSLRSTAGGPPLLAVPDIATIIEAMDALQSAAAREAKLREALRKRVLITQVHMNMTKTIECLLCCRIAEGDTEQHAPGCLAALQERE